MQFRINALNTAIYIFYCTLKTLSHHSTRILIDELSHFISFIDFGGFTCLQMMASRDTLEVSPRSQMAENVRDLSFPLRTWRSHYEHTLDGVVERYRAVER